MDPQLALTLINLSVLPAWILLIFAPRWIWTKRIIQSGLYPVGLGLTYFGLLVTTLIVGTGGDVDFTTIEGIAAIFDHPLGILTGWAHFLVFDLFVGMWEARDAERRGISHWLVAPCLFFTFMAGPFGLLLYFIVRRKWSLDVGASD